MVVQRKGAGGDEGQGGHRGRGEVTFVILTQHVTVTLQVWRGTHDLASLSSFFFVPMQPKDPFLVSLHASKQAEHTQTPHTNSLISAQLL